MYVTADLGAHDHSRCRILLLTPFHHFSVYNFLNGFVFGCHSHAQCSFLDVNMFLFLFLN